MRVATHDAAWAVRRDGKSQGGFFIGMAERRLLKGEPSHVSPLFQQTRKCPRVARSCLSWEVQSGNMTNEELEHIRLAYLEMNTGSVDLRNITAP